MGWLLCQIGLHQWRGRNVRAIGGAIWLFRSCERPGCKHRQRARFLMNVWEWEDVP